MQVLIKSIQFHEKIDSIWNKIKVPLFITEWVVKLEGKSFQICVRE